jgi:hypothetical protein
MKPCNENITEVLEASRKLLFLADKGDLQRDDDSCGVLFGFIRDTAYRIKEMAEAEKVSHIKKGRWESP